MVATPQNFLKQVRSFSGLVDKYYDYVACVGTSGNTIHTYTFRSGGSGGTIVAVIVMTYSSATSVPFDSVERTT